MFSLSVIFTLFISILIGFASSRPASNFTSQLDTRTTHTGRGTWFEVGLGNCGDWNVNSDPILAISIERYGDGGNCDQWVYITNDANGRTAYGKTRDSCQSCGESDIDMSPSLFEQLADLSVGEITVSWHFMKMGWSP